MHTYVFECEVIKYQFNKANQLYLTVGNVSNCIVIQMKLPAAPESANNTWKLLQTVMMTLWSTDPYSDAVNQHISDILQTQWGNKLGAWATVVISGHQDTMQYFCSV